MHRPPDDGRPSRTAALVFAGASATGTVATLLSALRAQHRRSLRRRVAADVLMAGLVIILMIADLATGPVSGARRRTSRGAFTRHR